MALPHSRTHTYAANQVQGVSFWLMIQSLIVGFVLRNRRKQQSLQLSIFGVQSDWVWSAANPGWVSSLSAATQHRVPLVMRANDRLVSVDVRYFRNGAGNMALNLYRRGLSSGSPDLVATTVLSGGPSVWVSANLSLSDHKFSDDHAYFFEVVSGNTGDRLGGLELAHYHP